jgi:hypothetical protein
MVEKKLCKLKKNDIENSLKDILTIVKSPKYICKKCARVANDKSYLCSSKKIEK